MAAGTAPHIIDARGLKCPMPVLKLEKWLETAPGNAVLILQTDDPVARIDVPLACKKRGCDYTSAAEGAALSFTITNTITE